MKTYQIQFRDNTRLWQAGPIFEMVPALLRAFLDYLETSGNREMYRAWMRESDEFRVVSIKCHNPHYRYNGGISVTNLRHLGSM
jgi:hypothetical protein